MEEQYWKYLNGMDADLLRELMEQFGQEVWNLAYILTKRHDLADDITQDVFFNAYRNIRFFRGESSIQTWLLSITRNTSINYLRTAFIRKVTLMEWVSDLGNSPSAEKEVLEQTFSDDIWRMVMELPLKYREVLILFGKYELSIKEIAKTLNISEGTVKSRMSRARKKMNNWNEGVGTYERS
ncbi:RNA polymerase sigma factor [Paenibacillus radicis (ex Gao et al. 2016)]|uniref:RNA polymerase sigma factor n=1 Tax=Paenibacillus radicis (ex Gao et al. 2016) TaxID=1737354 RepID=A0A917H4S3_9BACL|nr:sigma-70 family RNA polymerase sigma factor [Paenibacillus radicis (ex Gao et al. 2016)]GGG67960.1 RNA polymerase sigma factor [Paenibacillus radicis (ex Gao et al. 2016)]